MIHQRDYVIPEDLYALAEDALLHRMRLNYEALADGLTPNGVLQSMLNEMGDSRSHQAHESTADNGRAGEKSWTAI